MKQAISQDDMDVFENAIRVAQGALAGINALADDSNPHQINPQAVGLLADVADWNIRIMEQRLEAIVEAFRDAQGGAHGR